MPEFIFFKKGNTLSALEKSNVQGARLLLEQGYEKQFVVAKIGRAHV